MKTIVMAAASAAVIVAASPASAALSIAFQNGTNTFATQSLGNSLLLGPTIIGHFTVEGSFAASVMGHPNQLSDSNLTITNTSSSTQTLTFTVGDTSFTPRTAFVNMSGSGTFENAIGGSGSLSFHADTANGQGGVIVGGIPSAPGADLFNPMSGIITVTPFAFAGNKDGVPFSAVSPFSMTLDYVLTIPAGGSVVGLESAMTTGIPEPSTWAMLLGGFGLLGLGAWRRRKAPRLAV